MEHKFLRLFKDGEWTGNTDRTIRVNGVSHDLDEYAKEHGIDLPGKPTAPIKPKKVNIDIKETHEDLERSHDHRDNDIDGDGISESTE